MRLPLFLSLLPALLLTAVQPAAAQAPATIQIKVPANAAVTFDTLPTKQSGTQRLFVTPPLPFGQTFTYELEATWTENGKTRKVPLQAKVRGGERTVLDFTAPVADAGAERIGAPKKVLPAKTNDAREPSRINSTEPIEINPPKKAETPKKPPVPAKEPVKTNEPAKKDAKEKLEKLDEKKKDDRSALPRSRQFLFTYAGAVRDLKPGQQADVWLPLAPTSTEQDAAVVLQETTAPATIGVDREYGNRMLHFRGTADDRGQIPFKVVFKVARREVKTDARANVTVKPSESADLLTRFLQPDARVPTSGKPMNLLKDRKLPGDQFASAKVLYDMVDGHMKYSKEGTGWGQGDAVWACDSGFGNCSDFHSLFIALARGHKIPSKFEMGFPLPAKHGRGPVPGYHCWAWFLPEGKGWVPVDISEANRNPSLREYYFGNLTEDRVLFSRGRDITLEPAQKGPKLNFFIYPYVEVDGKGYDKVERAFAFEDVS